MLKKILIAFAAVVVVFLIVVMTRPSTFHVERSATMNAPAAVVFPYINDFHKFPEWSPWHGRDPNQKIEHGGPNEGVGATYHWAGNDEVGEGRQTITESVANQKVTEKLEFIKPFAATNTVTMTLKPAGTGTTMTWALDGDQNFMMKAMSLFMSMDDAVGKDFDQGLAKLKVITEKKAAETAAAEAAAAKAAAEAAAAAAAATGPTGPTAATGAAKKPGKKK